MTSGFSPVVLFLRLSVQAGLFWSAATELTLKNRIPDFSNALHKLTQFVRRANQLRSHPPMSVKWNPVSERARRIPVRVFEDTRAKVARNEICAGGGKPNHNSSRCGGSATLPSDPTCWSLANFDAEKLRRSRQKAKITKKLPAAKTACHKRVFWVPASLFR